MSGDKVFCCKYCHKQFAWKQARAKHEKDKVCINKQTHSDADVERVIETLKNNDMHQVAKFMTDLLEKVNVLTEKHDRMADRLGAMEKAMEKKPTIVVPTQIAGPVINNTGNNQTVNIIQQTLLLHNFGKEDTSHITHEEVMKWAADPANGVLLYLEKKHFDPSKPENHTIKLASIKRQEVDVHMDGTWTRHDAKPLAYKMIESTLDALQSGLDWSNITSEAEQYYEEVSSDATCQLGKLTAKQLLFLLHKHRELERQKALEAAAAG